MLSGFTDSTFIFCNILIFYFGVDQEKILLLFLMPYENLKKFYFKETNEHIAIWKGEKTKAFDVVELKQ
jgi:hypothetical protein